MNIAIYYTRPFECGGVEESMIEKAKIFIKQGHQITFIYKDSIPLKSMKKFAEVGDIIRADKDETKKYDAVIYESLYNNYKIEADKVILNVNGNVIDGNETIKQPFCVDEYVSVSEECAKQLKEKYNIDSKVIPNLISTERIKELETENVDIEKAKYNFVVVSRIDEIKGFDNLLKFVQVLDSKTKDYKIVVAGSNDNYPRYVQKIQSDFKGYNVEFIGNQKNPYKYMKWADYTIQLSKFESQCRVLYESLIVGTPVIATDFPNAVKDINSKNGFILKQDLSNLDIDKILDNAGTYDFKYTYKNDEKAWFDLIKPFEKKDIKFSIIIPNYNNGEYLEKCLTSVLNQTYKNYELIIVDDMSTDNSVQVINEMLEKFKEKKIETKFFINKSKRYNGGTRNVGIVEAESDYTLCIDSDDWLKDEYVLENINKEIRNEDIAILGFDLYNGHREGLFPYIPDHKDMFEVFKDNVCAIWTRCVKTSILKDTLFPEGTLQEDRVHAYRLLDKCKKFKDIKICSHTWNRANKHSVTTQSSTMWNGSAFKHLGEMYMFLQTTQNDEYRKYVQKKYDEMFNNLRAKKFSQI